MDDQQSDRSNPKSAGSELNKDIAKDVTIEALEKFLNQSVLGLHHLFDHEQISRILKTPTEEINFFNVENMNRIQKLFDQLLKCPSMPSKLAYIERLDPSSFEILVRTYFHIVESTIVSSGSAKH